MRNEIILFENQKVKLEVNMKDDTVWLTANQMANLFQRDEKTIRKHINNVFDEGELSRNNNTQKMRIDGVKQLVPFYNLDVIISVGYRVKSKNGVLFRKWANNILKDYLLRGYAVNQKRLEYLEKTVKLIDIASRMENRLENSDAKEILKVIGEYSKALELLDDYDCKKLKKVNGNRDNRRITYKDCKDIIQKLRFHEKSSLFAMERNNGLEAILGDIYQTYEKEDVYRSIEEKAANFLYMIVKNHVFIDGNKRVAATLFIYFLNFYNILYKDDNPVIDNHTLVALTLLLAESNPKEKDILIDLIMNFLQ